MSGHGRRRVRARRPGRVCDPAPTILVAGVVDHLEGLEALGRVQLAPLNLLAPSAAHSPADLVVVGRVPAGVAPTTVVAEIKDGPSTSAIPVLHAAPAEDACPECRADVCLSTGSSPGQLARVAQALLDLARARARSSGLYAARDSLAAGAAARPAP